MGTSAINLRLAKRGKWNSQFQTLDKKFKKRRWVLWIVFNVCLKKAVVFHAVFTVLCRCKFLGGVEGNVSQNNSLVSKYS